MAKIPRLVTSVKPPKRPAFDEKLWPVNMVLMVMAGFVAGIILATCQLDDPRFYYNGWVRLALLAGVVGLLMWFAFSLDNQRVRRGLQLAVLLSMFAHISAMIVLHSPQFEELATTTKPVDHPSENAVRGPRITSFDPERSDAPDELTKPTDVEIASEQEQPIDVVRKPAELQETPKSQPTPAPGTTPEVRPSLVELRQLEEARPRHASPESRPGKQVAKVDLPPGESAAVPQAKIENKTPIVDAKANALDRRPQELAMATRKEAIVEKGPVQPRAAEMTARERAETAAASSPATATAKNNKPSASSPGEAQAPQMEKSGGKPNLEPGASIARQPSQPSMAGGMGKAESEAAKVTQLASLDNRPRGGDPRAADLPTATASKTPGAGRTTQAPVIAADIGDKPQLPAGRGKVAEPSFDPSTTRVARASAAAGTGGVGDPSQGFANLPATGKGGVPGMQIERAAETGAPGVTTGAGGNRVARARRTAKIDASPIAAEGAGLTASAEPGRVAAEPGGRAALARRATSIPGVGTGNRVEPGLVGGDTMSSLPAARARRAAAAGPSEASGSLAGSGSPARLSKSSLGKRAPAAADDIAMVGLGGAGGGDGAGASAAGPRGVDASGSATVNRAQGAGSLPGEGKGGTGLAGTRGAGSGGEGSGIAGTGGLEIGEGNISGRSSANRLSAGQSPRVAVNGQGQRIGKTGSGSGGTSAIAAQGTAELPEAPGGDGGGGALGGAAFGDGDGEGALAGALAPSGSGSGRGRGNAGAGLPAGTGLGAAGNIPDGPGGGRGGANRVARAVRRAIGTGDGDGDQPGLGQPGGGAGYSGSRGRSTAAAVAKGNADAGAVASGTGNGTGNGNGTGTGDGTGGGTGDASEVAGAGGGSGVGARRGSAGLPGGGGGAAGQGNFGGAEVAAQSLGTGTGQGSQRRPGGSDGAPQVAVESSIGTLRRSASQPGSILAEINGQAVDVSAEGSAPSASDVADIPPPQSSASGLTNVVRRAGGGGLPIEVASLPQVGGLGAGVLTEIGSIDRRAHLDTAAIQPGTARFLNRKVGGPLAIDGRARQPTEAFAGRTGQRKTKKGGGAQAERNEAAIAKGLEFLARHQADDGHWSLNFGAGRPGYEEEHASFQSDTAATGLALLSFLGAGYDHFDDEYRHVVRDGLEFLLQHQKPDGDLYLPMDAQSNQSAWFYSHGIATIALCEAYGMTGDDALHGPAQRAVDFIVKSQSTKLGVWRYAPGFGSDTSASGWQLMALKSGELAGLKIPQQTYPRVKRWLDAAQVSKTDGSQYVYNPFAADTEQQRHGRRATPAMTAVGLLMRLYTGWNRNDPQMIAGAEHLLAELPAIGTQGKPSRDTYYWYYATQVMFHMGDRYWKAWNDRLHPLLVERQVQTGPMAGSWDPLLPVPDRWGLQAGRMYVTTLNLLSLEVYYRHLPIYEATAK